MTALTAEYTPGKGEVKLALNVIVTSVAGQVYSTDREGHSVEAGDKARLRATYDFPLHKGDFMQVRYGCSACDKSSAGLQGLHIHDFRVDTDNKLRITIGAPKQLAGACRCRGTTTP